MTVAPVDRFHDAPDEGRWRTLFESWRTHMQGLSDYLERTESPWAWGEQANVGLLASAHDRTPGGWSMLELPVRRDATGGDGAGRFDLWLGGAGWSVHAEAKRIWAKTPSATARATMSLLDRADGQAAHLVGRDWTTSVASIAFVVPNPTWTGRTSSAAVGEEFAVMEQVLWAHNGQKPGTFQTHFLLPLDQIRRDNTTGRVFPGVILCGRIHKAKAP